MKKKIVTICLVVALLLTAAGGTLAYFTASDDEENTFTVGNVDIELTEESWITEGEGADMEDVYPGQILPKDPVVTNEGSNPCFVRISVEGLDALGEEHMIKYGTNGDNDVLGSGWTEYDGYYYFMATLAAGESTSALFEYIAIPTTVVNDFSEAVYSVDVFAEAVQSQGFTGNAAAVADIAAWFTTCME